MKTRRQQPFGRWRRRLNKISAERIRVELTKLLMSDHPELINDACELGITKVILPEWDAMVGVQSEYAAIIFSMWTGIRCRR